MTYICDLSSPHCGTLVHRLTCGSVCVQEWTREGDDAEKARGLFVAFICWRPERGDYTHRNKVAELTEQKPHHHQRERGGQDHEQREGGSYSTFGHLQLNQSDLTKQTQLKEFTLIKLKRKQLQNEKSHVEAS